jgi:hypothetical protein
MRGYPTPLTWARLLELAAQGHDHYDPALTSDRARQLVASVREHCKDLEERNEAGWAIAKARLASFRAATATLERVRAEVDKWSGSGCEDGDTPAFCAMVGIAAALARPGFEAPKEQAEMTPTERMLSKSWAAQMGLRDDLAAKARIAELEESERKACRLVREIAQERDDSQRRDLERLAAVAGARDAANAKIAELEATAQRHLELANAYLDDLAAANAKVLELKSEAEALTHHREFLLNDRSGLRLKLQAAAANAKIAELEAEANDWKADRHETANALHRASIRTTAANARADAASAEHTKEAESLHRRLDDALARADASEQEERIARRLRVVELERAMKAETERDQLAARVTTQAAEIERWKVAFAEACTPEEREVLKAARDAHIYPNANGVGYDFRLVEVWSAGRPALTCPVAEAELANRAAKALKPPAEPSDRS